MTCGAKITLLVHWESGDGDEKLGIKVGFMQSDCYNKFIGLRGIV